MRRVKKGYLVPITALVLVFLGCAIYVNIFASPITDGPLAMAAEATTVSWTQCTPGQTGEIMFFGSNTFPSNPNHSRNDAVTITCIKPVTLPSGLKQTGMGIMQDGPTILGGPLTWAESQNSHPIEKLPVSVHLNKNSYQPVVLVKATKPGVYTIPGLIVTYTDDGRTYSDYFRGQFQLAANSTCPNDVPMTPKRLPGMLPWWLAWMRIPQ